MKSLSYCFLHSQKWSLIAKQSKVSLIFSRKLDFSRAKGSCIVQLCPTNSMRFYNKNQNRCRSILQTEALPVSSMTSPCVFRVWFLLTPCPSSTWREVLLTRSFLTCAGTLPGWDESSHQPCTADSSTAAPTAESSLMTSSARASRNQVMSARCHCLAGCQRNTVWLKSERNWWTFMEHSSFSLTSEITDWFK